MGLTQEPRQVDVQESWDVAEIEQTDMSEVDRFLVKQFGRNHPHCDRVPCRPEGFPLGEGGNRERAGSGDTMGRFKEGEYKRWPLEEP